MRRRTPPRALAAAALFAAGSLLAGCSADPAPAADPDRLVLTPPEDGADHTHAPGEEHGVPIGDGSTASAGGYRMVDVTLPRRAEGPGDISFRVLGPDDRPVTDYVEEQTKLLHLYVVRSDYAVFRHLHPELGDDGRWTVRADLGEPGDYQVLVEFHPAEAATAVALGVERTVPGAWQPETVPTAVEEEDGSGTPVPQDDGVVAVRLDGAGEVGQDGRLTLLVTDRGGRPLPLESYLGTDAHLTGFPLGGVEDAGYVHVHPYGAAEQTEDGTRLVFHTTFTEPGDYRFFVQVRVEGMVHTVPVTVPVTA